MQSKFEISVGSEIGRLEGVIIHRPGPEIENMTPGNVERALYSDILNISVAMNEFSQLQGVLEKYAKVFEVSNLLTDILKNEKVKSGLISRICKNEGVMEMQDYLLQLDETELARQFIEGVVMRKDSLTKFLSKQRYSLQPLHNFFYTRDAAISILDKVLIASMASKVRERESIIMEAIFDFHPHFNTTTVNPSSQACQDSLSIEGGDILVAREDVLLIGIGARTTSQGVDFILNHIKKKGKLNRHIIIQELPLKPESFIHLDMVFTFLDRDNCMIYEPVIMRNNKLQTVHITLDAGKVVSIEQEDNILSALHKLNFDLQPVFCGGTRDPWYQEREQWHSGANFFAIAPGQIIGYGRNVYTIEELSKFGYEVHTAENVISGKSTPSENGRWVITIEGSELPRGGGGARCMTMPIRRKKVDW